MTRHHPPNRSPLLLLLVLVLAGCSPSRAPLVVYCAHDSIYAETILRDFERRTGIPVAVKFDTEATKSLGLVELLLRERDHPRCDLFWNNELLGTLQLADAGWLQPYCGPGHARIPSAWKDPAGRWTGFAARLRVWIVNTNKLADADAAIAGGADFTRLAIAKPLYGTTRTQYTLLWRQEGAARLQAWHRDWRARGVREVNGNATVKNLVAEGVCDLGLTDTDDFFEAQRGGKPVVMRPVRLPGAGRTIAIPNTIALIRGTPRLAAAQQLADHLLSAETELALARGAARQIPLGPVADTDLPAEVRELRRWANEAGPLTGLGAAPAECLAWLKSEYLK